MSGEQRLGEAFAASGKHAALMPYVMAGFPTQAGRQWFTEDTFWAMLRVRGVEANSPTRYAEAFYGRKVVL